ncbi:butyrophilin subfamily 1 member A1-like [Sardina pilchardus]|uniref:butyrophilin subfamily 1 member A1-like n=1 Tax=Sardina pilchardus TaxID=27697 RepID=UPI002E109AD2
MLHMWMSLCLIPLTAVATTAGTPDPELFSVTGSEGPVSAPAGSSVTLPCGLSPSSSAVPMLVRWNRPNVFSTPVLLYENHQVQEEPADPRYRGRVSLVGDLQKGNVSLRLEKLTLEDRGEYVCHVGSDVWFDEISIRLIVTGGGQVNVTCESDGWSPEPTVTWRDREGTEIHQNYSNIHFLKDVVRRFSPQRKPTECNGHRAESGPYRKQEQAEASAAAMNLTLDMKRVPPFFKVQDNDTSILCPDSSKVLGTEMRFPHALCDYKFYSGKHYWEVKMGNMWSGHKGKQSWYVGVCTDTAEQIHRVSMTPQNGFWVLQYEKVTGLFVNTEPPTKVCVSEENEIQYLGVFLDYDEHTLTFYRADPDRNMCICSLYLTSGKPLIPLISPGVRDKEPIKLVHVTDTFSWLFKRTGDDKKGNTPSPEPNGEDSNKKENTPSPEPNGEDSDKKRQHILFGRGGKLQLQSKSPPTYLCQPGGPDLTD